MSGTRDTSKGSLSPGWLGGEGLGDSGRTVEAAASAIIMSSSCGGLEDEGVSLRLFDGRLLFAPEAADREFVGLASASACIARKSSKWFPNVFCDWRIFLTLGVCFSCAAIKHLVSHEVLAMQSQTHLFPAEMVEVSRSLSLRRDPAPQSPSGSLPPVSRTGR